MHTFATSFSVVCLLAISSLSSAQSLEVTQNGEQQAITGSDKFFTGTSIVNPYFSNKEAGVSGASVTFAPGSRSAWHTHPTGQHLVITEGSGYVQEWGKEKQTIKPGDVVWTPPGVKHWHGAAEHSMMSHIAIQQFGDGKNVVWMEKVSDEEYLQTPVSR